MEVQEVWVRVRLLILSQEKQSEDTRQRHLGLGSVSSTASLRYVIRQDSNHPGTQASQSRPREEMQRFVPQARSAWTMSHVLTGDVEGREPNPSNRAIPPNH